MKDFLLWLDDKLGFFARKYIDIDGFAHILISLMILAYFKTYSSVAIAVVVWAGLSILKEAVDILIKKKNPKDSIRDLALDCGGLVLSLPVLLG